MVYAYEDGSGGWADWPWEHGVGERLDRVNAALRAWDAAIGAPSEDVLGVVDYIDLGNEIDASHYQGAPHGLSPIRQERSWGEIGVAMEFPESPEPDSDSFLENTNEQVQASKLVRTLAAALAAGADRVAWFNFYNGTLKETALHKPAYGWTSNFATMGLHHDADFTGSFQSSVGAAEWLWRKPNWYSFQRLAWLLSCAKEGQPTLVVSEDGATLIRVAFGHAPLTGPTGKAMSGSFRFAWLMWLDQYAGSRCRYPNGDGLLPDLMTVRLSLGRDAISRPNTDLGLLLMVPAVEATGGPGPLDSAGYRAIDAIDWEWPEWDAALRSWATSTSPDAPEMELRVLRGRLEAARNLTTPLCILCNLDAGELT